MVLSQLLPPANRVCGKVIFLQVCVILSTGGGVYPIMQWASTTMYPLGTTYPPWDYVPPQTTDPLDYVPQTTYPPDYIPPWTMYPRTTYPPPRDYIPPGLHTPPGICTLPVDGLCEGSSHPTGMHSCIGYLFMLQNLFFQKKILIDTHTKIWTEVTAIIIFMKKLLKFLQGENVCGNWICTLMKQVRVHRITSNNQKTGVNVVGLVNRF